MGWNDAAAVAKDVVISLGVIANESETVRCEGCEVYRRVDHVEVT